MPVTIVVARAANGVIGWDGGLPWHLPADLAHFKRVTMGRAVVMGRRTWESLPGPLPGRRHIVLSRDPRWHAWGAERAASLADALAMAGPDACVVGGAAVIDAALPLADAIELTEIHRAYAGDVELPDFPPAHWREVERVEHAPDGDRPAHAFVTLEPIGSLRP